MTALPGMWVGLLLDSDNRIQLGFGHWFKAGFYD
jgi:hypothetical protein